MRKTIWIARDKVDDHGAGYYVLCTEEPTFDCIWEIVGHGFDIPPEEAEHYIRRADRLKPGEGPKRIKIQLGG